MASKLLSNNYQAPSRAIARKLTAGLIADYGREQE
jgi:hypothetical protein